MNRKIVSVNNIKLEDGLVAWNHSAFKYSVLVSWLGQNNDLEFAAPKVLHSSYLEYKSISDNLSRPSQMSVKEIISNILDTLPPQQEEKSFFGYANHLAIFKLGVLINETYRHGHDKPQDVLEMLEKLVDHANASAAECFQVSVHHACKFFIQIYGEDAEKIRDIIAKQKYQKALSQIDRNTVF